MDNTSIGIEIEKAEEELRIAMLSSNIAVLDKLLSSNLIFTNHLGMVVTKEQDLLMHQSGDLKISEIVLSEMVIKELGGVVAVSVKAKIESVFKGDQNNVNFRFTRVWSKECDTWVVVIGHSCIAS